MSEIVTLTPDHTLLLPAEIAQHFKPSDRFITWLEGDTLHLKRITPSPLKVVEQAPDEEPMSLDEINDIVHEVRRQRQERKS
ncbi:MAG: hypothetical protein U0350_33975 [Caldilineaceae bacterium]